MSSNVVIAVRIRPESTVERNGNYSTIISKLDDKMLVFDPAPTAYDGQPNLVTAAHREKRPPLKRRYKDIKFAFDTTLERASQEDVFQATAAKMLDPVFDGFNATVFAYGATGAGKTYTMMGDPKRNTEGVMMLTMLDIFKRIEDRRADKKVNIAVSYVEIYNERIRDLLAPTIKGKPRVLDLREDPAKGMVIADLSEERPTSAADVISIIARGTSARTQYATAANEQSSRSHAVFQVRIEQQNRTADINEPMSVGKLSMIDLAGSERACRTQNRGSRLVEGANINRSLLALGNCINALCQPAVKGKKQFVPYRNSKLTRLLKDSLGGNCKTCMIANISPSSYNYEDTLNTLKYANRAKEIKTTATRNMLAVRHGVAEYTRIITELRGEVGELKATIAGLRAENARLRALVGSGGMSMSMPETEATLNPANMTPAHPTHATLATIEEDGDVDMSAGVENVPPAAMGTRQRSSTSTRPRTQQGRPVSTTQPIPTASITLGRPKTSAGVRRDRSRPVASTNALNAVEKRKRDLAEWQKSRQMARQARTTGAGLRRTGAIAKKPQTQPTITPNRSTRVRPATRSMSRNTGTKSVRFSGAGDKENMVNANTNPTGEAHNAPDLSMTMKMEELSRMHSELGRT